MNSPRPATFRVPAAPAQAAAAAALAVAAITTQALAPAPAAQAQATTAHATTAQATPAQAAPGPAQASGRAGHAGTGGWRAFAMLSVPGRFAVPGNVDAVSAADAWVSGTLGSRDGAPEGPLIAHWNGEAWRRVKLPARAARHFGKGNFLTLIGASSSRNAWAFSLRGSYLRLNGTTWTSGRLPAMGRPAHAHTFILQVRVFSPADVWVFGGVEHGRVNSEKFTPLAARFNGTRWTRVPVPGKNLIGSVSAISASDMWALSGGSIPDTGLSSKPVISHWNGSRWQEARTQPKLARNATLATILARSDTDVWIGGSVANRKSGSSELARHWNGRAWTAAAARGAKPGRFLRREFRNEWETGTLASWRRLPRRRGPALAPHGPVLVSVN